MSAPALQLRVDASRLELRQDDVALAAGVHEELFTFTFRTRRNGKPLSSATSSTEDLGESCTVETLHVVEAEGFAEPRIDKIRVEYALVRVPAESGDGDLSMLLVRGEVHFAAAFRDKTILADHFGLLQTRLSIPPESDPAARRYPHLWLCAPPLLLLLALHSPAWLALAAAACALALLAAPRRTHTGRVFFVNGWQAWSFCGAVQQGCSPPAFSMPSVFVRAFHAGSRALDINLASSTWLHWLLSSPAQLHIASDLFTVIANTGSGKAVCIGFLSQKTQFGYVACDRSYGRVVAGCECDGALATEGAVLHTDWLAVQLQPAAPDDVLGAYYSLAGAYSSQSPMDTAPSPLASASASAPSSVSAVPVGWCSWYHFFDKVTEQDLYSNIVNLSQIQRDLCLPERMLFQIDDGYQEAWGDWLSLHKTRFPSQSMPELVRAIKAAGMRPGVWAAPFACDQHSQLAKDHPDWLLRRRGSAVRANSGNCGKWFYGLDVTHPEVQNFVLNTFEKVVHEWGFTYLKLDFLYAAALEHGQQGFHNPHLTRAQAMHIGLDLVRRARGEGVLMLGCGAPLGSVIGRVHANRISADAGLSWDPGFPLPSGDCWNLPCARNMVRNTVCRLGMHGRWWINDPDCILLRASTYFSEQEIIGIASVKAMSGGSIILSDDLATVSQKRLGVMQSILPVLGIAAVPIDLLQREMPELLRLALASEWTLADGSAARQTWVVLALCNWVATSRTHTVELRHLLHGDCPPAQGPGLCIVALDFWAQRVLVLSGDRRASVAIPVDVPLHSAALLAFRPILHRNRPLFLGSNIHFSCGKEISSCEFSPSGKGGEMVVDVFAHFMMQPSFASEFWFYIPLSPLECGLLVDLNRTCAFCEVVREVENFGSVMKASPLDFEATADKRIRRFRLKM